MEQENQLESNTQTETTNPIFETSSEIQRMNDVLFNIKKELGKVIVGQTDIIDMMLVAMLAGGHILLEGVPGVAKTLTAKLLAKTIAVDFSRIQFTPDLMPSDVMGTNVFNPQKIEFEFKRGPIFSNIVLIDEINRAPAKTQAALFEVMEEQTITIDGVSYVLGNPFMVIATQNPVEHEGTYQLPEAQLDRFAFKLFVNYPNENEEVEILNRHQSQHSMHDMIGSIQTIITSKELDELKQTVTAVTIEPHLVTFIAKIVQQTRSHRAITLGASPRASVTLLNTAKALATLRGRNFVTPDDILAVAKPALRHRISLAAEKEMEGTTTDEVINDMIASIEVPR